VDEAAETAMTLAGLALAAIALVTGVILGRTFEADRWRRDADRSTGGDVRCRERWYRVCRIPKPEGAHNESRR